MTGYIQAMIGRTVLKEVTAGGGNDDGRTIRGINGIISTN